METAPKKKKSKAAKIVLYVIIAFVILGIIGSLGDDKKKTNSSESVTTTQDANSKDETQKEIGLNEPLQTEYFVFQVNSAKLAKSVTVDGYGISDLKQEEGNQYLILNISLKNTDKESRMMTDGKVIVENNGQSYSYENAETIMQDGWGILVDNINPGITKTTKIVYKVPADLKGTVYYVPGRADDNERIKVMTL